MLVENVTNSISDCQIVTCEVKLAMKTLLYRSPANPLSNSTGEFHERIATSEVYEASLYNESVGKHDVNP